MFYYEGKCHGLCEITYKEKGTVKYYVYDMGSWTELSEDDVEAINAGTKHVPQMDVFKDPVFGYEPGVRIDFNWMNKQGRNIVVLADDLVELAHKHDLDKHVPD